jgi:predicted NBD/HSP70 family sugar kinase
MLSTGTVTPVTSAPTRQPALTGTPSLMREMNVRAALALLVEHGPLSRAELASLTGLSKVTTGQLLGRLGELGLAEIVGTRSGARGPNAEVHGVVASAAYVVGVDVGPRRLTASACDLVGKEGPRVHVSVPARGPRSDPKVAVEAAVTAALEAAGAPRSRLRGVAIGLPGLVVPETGDVGFSFDLPRWQSEVRGPLEASLCVDVLIDNDVNLAAVAEHRAGAATGVQDFVLLWVGRGIGSAIVLSGEVHRGASGAAGELGYLPVPGVELPHHISRRDKGAFQRLAGEEAILELAGAHGVKATDAISAIQAGDAGLLDDLAHRLAVGVAAVCAVVDPGLVVLTGPVAVAGGPALCERVAEAAASIAPVHPRVVPTGVPDAPVLRGAHLVALDSVRRFVADG